MRVGNSFKRKDITEESMKLKGSMDVDPSLREALTDADEGIFRPGALPKMQTSSTNGNKLLLDAVEKARACGWHVVGTRARTCNCLTTQGQMHYVRFLLGYHGYPIFSLEIAHTPSKHPLMQVVAAPKKKAKDKENADKAPAEEVVPQTWEEKAKDIMGELTFWRCKGQNWVHQAFQCSVCQGIVRSDAATCSKVGRFLQRDRE